MGPGPGFGGPLTLEHSPVQFTKGFPLPHPNSLFEVGEETERVCHTPKKHSAKTQTPSFFTSAHKQVPKCPLCAQCCVVEAWVGVGLALLLASAHAIQPCIQQGILPKSR